MTDEERFQYHACQACWLHSEHERCTGSTTLGVRKCICAEQSHNRAAAIAAIPARMKAEMRRASEINAMMGRKLFGQ